MKTYKDINYINITFSIIGAVIIGLAIGFTSLDKRILVGVLVLWLAGNTLFWEYMARRRSNKFEGLLARGDLEEYINFYETLDQNFPKKGDLTAKNDVKLRLAKGLYADGEFDEMKWVLDRVNVEKYSDTKELLQKIDCHRNLALYYIEKGDLASAEAELSVCYPLFENPKFKEPKRSQALDECEKVYAIMQIKQGNLEGLDGKFKEWMRYAETPLDKAAASYRLGEIYLAHDMTEEAKQQFNFVVKYGGDSYYGMRAQGVLDLKGKHKPVL